MPGWPAPIVIDGQPVWRAEGSRKYPRLIFDTPMGDAGVHWPG